MRDTLSYDEVVHTLKTAPIKGQIKMGPPDPRRRSHYVFVLGGWQRRSDIHREFGTTARAMENRLASGWTLEAAATVKIGTVPHRDKRVTAGGTTKTVGEWSKISGVQKFSINARLKRGWTPEQAVGLEPYVRVNKSPRKRTVKQKYIEAGGLRLSLDQWAAKLGITVGTIQGRLTLGWTEAQAVGVEPSAGAIKAEKAAKLAAEKLAKKQASQITYKGVTGSVSDVCRHFGVTDSLVRGRIKLGWSAEQAIETPVYEGGITLKRVKVHEEAAKRNKVKHHTIDKLTS